MTTPDISRDTKIGKTSESCPSSKTDVSGLPARNRTCRLGKPLRQWPDTEVRWLSLRSRLRRLRRVIFSKYVRLHLDKLRWISMELSFSIPGTIPLSLASRYRRSGYPSTRNVWLHVKASPWHEQTSGQTRSHSSSSSFRGQWKTPSQTWLGCTHTVEALQR